MALLARVWLAHSGWVQILETLKGAPNEKSFRTDLSFGVPCNLKGSRRPLAGEWQDWTGQVSKLRQFQPGKFVALDVQVWQPLEVHCEETSRSFFVQVMFDRIFHPSSAGSLPIRTQHKAVNQPFPAGVLMVPCWFTHM